MSSVQPEGLAGDGVAAQGAADANGLGDAAAGATVVWFKQDLRVDDHPGLIAAAADGRAVCVYVIDPACMPCAPPQLLRTAVRVPVSVCPTESYTRTAYRLPIVLTSKRVVWLTPTPVPVGSSAGGAAAVVA